MSDHYQEANGYPYHEIRGCLALAQMLVIGTLVLSATTYLVWATW